MLDRERKIQYNMIYINDKGETVVKGKAVGSFAALLAVLLIISAFVSCTGDGEQPDGSSVSDTAESEAPSYTGNTGEPSQSGTADNGEDGSSGIVTEESPEPFASGTSNDDEGWSKYY